MRTLVSRRWPSYVLLFFPLLPATTAFAQDCDVMGMFMFHQDGSRDHAMVDGERVEYSGATRRPFTTVIPEMFKVRDGKITRIIATMASIPYKSKSGWDE